MPAPMRGESARLPEEENLLESMVEKTKPSDQELAQERANVYQEVRKLQRKIEQAPDEQTKKDLQLERDHAARRLSEIDEDLEERSVEIPHKIKEVPKPVDFGEDSVEEEKARVSDEEQAKGGEPIVPETISGPMENQEAEPSIDEAALVRHAEMFEQAEEAARQEAQERELAEAAKIENARTWAQKEAEGAKRVGRVATKAGKVGGKGALIGAKGAGIAAATGVGLFAHAARLPMAVAKKAFGVADNLLEMLQNKLGGPVIKFFERAFAKKDKKDKKE